MANSTTPRRGTTPQARRTGQPRKATGNARTGFTPRPSSARRKPAKQQSKAAGLLSAVTKALPSGQQAKSKAKAAPKRAGGPGGLALLAGAGGLAAALTQRDKLKGLVGGQKNQADTTTVTNPIATASPSSAETVVDPITNGPAGTQPGPNAV
jgi:hypothetical protein